MTTLIDFLDAAVFLAPVILAAGSLPFLLRNALRSAA
jgi:hypothetical protein